MPDAIEIVGSIKLVLAATVAMLSIGLIGCGEDDGSPPQDDAEQIRVQIASYGEALRDRDGERVCDLIDPQSIPDDELAECVRAFSGEGSEGEELPSGETVASEKITSVSVDKPYAEVDLESGGTIELVQRQDIWYLQLLD